MSSMAYDIWEVREEHTIARACVMLYRSETAVEDRLVHSEREGTKTRTIPLLTIGGLSTQQILVAFTTTAHRYFVLRILHLHNQDLFPLDSQHIPTIYKIEHGNPTFNMGFAKIA